jgi:hypothetical protein
MIRYSIFYLILSIFMIVSTDGSGGKIADISDWISPVELAKQFPYYKSGFTVDGTPGLLLIFIFLGASSM